MSVVEVLNVKLQRTDPSVSWGFNVQGGKEFNCPLVIQRVNPGSLAERCSIRPNDYILKIGSLSTEHLTHNQARDSIVRQGNNLELTLQRGAPPRPDDYAAKLDFSGQHQLMNPENIERPVLSPQVGVQLGKNKALLTQSYNSPMGLYSSQNIADTLVSSMKNRDMKPSIAINPRSLSSDSDSVSASASPVSSSSLSNNVPDVLSQTWMNKKLDLNPRPKPFKKSVISSEVNIPSKHCSIIVNPELNSVNTNDENQLFRAIPMYTNKNQGKDEKPYHSYQVNEEKRDNFYVNNNVPAPVIRQLSSDDPNKHVKISLSKELQSRLNSNLKMKNKENTAVNGRLFTKHQSIDYNNNNLPLNESKNLSSRRNRSMGNVFKQLDERYSDKDSHDNLAKFDFQKVNTRAAYSSQLPRRSIATLDDPTKQSCAQSRTFKLLQETLDNELEENDHLVHDSFLNKHMIKRCSLKPSFDDNNRPVSRSNIIDSRKFTKSDSLIDQTKYLKKYSLPNQIDDNEMDKESLARKKYIRSLSIAKDPSAEPLFLQQKLSSKSNTSIREETSHH